MKLQRAGPSGLSAEIALPAGLPGRFVWRGRTVDLQGTTRLRCEETCRPR